MWTVHVIKFDLVFSHVIIYVYFFLQLFKTVINRMLEMFGSEAVDPVSSHDVPSPGAGAGVLLLLLSRACRDIVEGKSPSTPQHGRQTFLHRPARPKSLSCHLLHQFLFCLLVRVMSHQMLGSDCPGVGAGTRVIQEPLSPQSVCCSSEN